MNSRPWRDAATVACQRKVVCIPDLIPQPDWDKLLPNYKYHFSGTELWQRRAKGREFIMPPRRTGFNEYMPQGQRTLTEVDRLRRAGDVRGGVWGVATTCPRARCEEREHSRTGVEGS